MIAVIQPAEQSCDRNPNNVVSEMKLQDVGAQSGKCVEPVDVGKDVGVRPRVAVEFEAELTRESTEMPFGWHLDLLDGRTIFINSVRQARASTPVQVYNASVPEVQRIAPGDHIVKVDGKEAQSAMELSELLQNACRARITVVRPLSFSVHLKKQLDKHLGARLKYDNAGSTVVIHSIDAGLIQDSGVDVCAGDRIHSVCGSGGSTEAIIEALRTNTDLSLVLTRAV